MVMFFGAGKKNEIDWYYYENNTECYFDTSNRPAHELHFGGSAAR